MISSYLVNHIVAILTSSFTPTSTMSGLLAVLRASHTSCPLCSSSISDSFHCLFTARLSAKQDCTKTMFNSSVYPLSTLQINSLQMCFTLVVLLVKIFLQLSVQGLHGVLLLFLVELAELLLGLSCSEN